MLNVKYYKDLNHNYLIIKEKMREEEQSYQHKMITSNRMKHLLDCRIRYVDEECHFYYEISSKQSITGLFATREWGYEQLRRFFENMQEALSEVENYLLDSRRLVLQPEYIYVEPETEEFFFLYYPYYAEGDEMGTQMSLSQFLVDKVDHTQDDAVAIVYKVYEMEQDQQFILSEVIGMFSEKESDAETVTEEAYSYDMDMLQASEYEDSGEMNWESSRNGEDGQEETAPKHLLAAGILLGLCMIAAAGIFVLRTVYSLSIEENLFSVIGMVILCIAAALLFLYLSFNLYSGRKKKTENTISESMLAMKTPNNMSVYNDNSYIQSQKNSQDNHEEYGNTVFLEDTMCRKENKLYGTNKGNKYHIDLGQLPCTVGKMAGSVDVVIKDSTISRIHARFTKQEEGICVTDMNSTNGTFKNGLRLEPNEMVLIEPGDELRFGRMTFSYR